MTWALLVALWIVLMLLILAFFRGTRMLDPSPPDADDIEWAKQAFAEIDRADAARKAGQP